MRAATLHFHQGFVLDGQPFAYAANFQYPIWEATRRAAVVEGHGDIVAVRGYFPHAIIVSQTCDVCDDSPRTPKQPWITVVPVYDIFSDMDRGQQKQIRRRDFLYLVPLTAPEFSGEGTLWIADLRLEYPIEKGRLVGVQLRPGFANDADALDFGLSLAARRNRPSIDNVLRATILLPLVEAFDSATIPDESIEEVRLRVEPSMIAVERVVVYVIVREGTDIAELRELFDEFFNATTAALPDGITLMDVKIETAATLRYDEMRSTVRIALDDFR